MKLAMAKKIAPLCFLIIFFCALGIEISSIRMAKKINTLFERENVSVMDYAFMGGGLLLELESSNRYKQYRIRHYVSDKSKKTIELLEQQVLEMEREVHEMDSIF